MVDREQPRGKRAWYQEENLKNISTHAPEHFKSRLSRKIAILILAAGASTRMGKPKQLMEWKGTTLLGHAIDEASTIENSIIFVTLGANSDAIKSAHIQKDVKWVFNSHWESGLGTSIALGAKAILENEPKIPKILVMLADQPLIDSEYLEQMISSFHIVKKGIVATGYGKGPGVPALFDQQYYEKLMGLNSDKGAKYLLLEHQQDVELVFAGDKTKDIDTLKDYNHLKELKL